MMDMVRWDMHRKSWILGGIHVIFPHREDSKSLARWSGQSSFWAREPREAIEAMEVGDKSGLVFQKAQWSRKAQKAIAQGGLKTSKDKFCISPTYIGRKWVKQSLLAFRNGEWTRTISLCDCDHDDVLTANHDLRLMHMPNHSSFHNHAHRRAK